MAAARSRIWAAAAARMAAVARMAAAGRLSISAVAARRMAAAALVARDTVDGIAMLARDAAATRIAGNRIHRLRLLLVNGTAPQSCPNRTVVAASYRCRRKIMP